MRRLFVTTAEHYYLTQTLLILIVFGVKPGCIYLNGMMPGQI